MRISDWISDVCSSDPTFTALDAGADNTGTTSATAALTKLKQYIVTESGGTTTSNDKAVCVVIPPGKYKVDGFGVDWRSDERCVGKGGGSTVRSGWSPFQ